MIKSRIPLSLLIFLSVLATSAQPPDSGFDRSEFAGRRQKFFARIPDGIAVIPGALKTSVPVRFRQAPDFWYLTGIEDPESVLVLDGRSRKSYLFAPKRGPQEVMVEGPGLLEAGRSADHYGLTKIGPLEQLPATVKALGKAAKRLYLPLSPQDSVQEGRMEIAMGQASVFAHPLYAGMITERQIAVKKIQAWLPKKELADVHTILDDLRWVKTPYEIERMRAAGRIAAEATREAIAVTRPGGYEYEIEAAVRGGYLKRGARGDAFPPIVASGPNTITWHYTANNRQMQAGEIVLMDLGADYEYYTSDITRTWPVSGRFTAEQEKHYRCILEARDAVIAAMKPGITVAQMQDIAARVYSKHGFSQQFDKIGRYIGHYVGISVHDVGPMLNFNKPLEPGVVFNVEPILEFRDRKLHYRLEDTILITRSGAENLTSAVPADLEGLYALLVPRP